jgi:hypothetical protein
MYAPHTIHQIYAIKTRTTRDQRAIDEQAGRVAAAVTALGRRIAARTRVGSQAGQRRAEFRNAGVNSPADLPRGGIPHPAAAAVRRMQ